MLYKSKFKRSVDYIEFEGKNVHIYKGMFLREHISYMESKHAGFENCEYFLWLFLWFLNSSPLIFNDLVNTNVTTNMINYQNVV